MRILPAAPTITFALAVFAPLAAASSASATAGAPNGTTLGIRDTVFTLNEEPSFLLGISYYAALGAPRDFILADLEDFQKIGFNWIRVWATSAWFGRDVSAVDGEGEPREPFLENLAWLVAECDRRRIVVDVTLARGQETADQTESERSRAGRIHHFAGHTKAVEVLCRRLQGHRNWFLDLANERDVSDARFVPPAELRQLRVRVREIDPDRLVTASWMGRNLTPDDVPDAAALGLDFLAPHRPRHSRSPTQTEGETRSCLATMTQHGLRRPILYQEPFRRGYTKWNPTAYDFLTDMDGAIKGGAAGWCFHNGDQSSAPDRRPGRCFDLSAARLIDQLDPVELEVLARLALRKRGGLIPFGDIQP